jgi:hypothetical protein
VSDAVSDTVSARVVLAATGVLLVGLFLAALVESTPPAAIHVAVMAEPRADVDAAPYLVRLSAVDARAQRSVSAAGRVQLGTASALFEDGIARLAVDPRATALELTLEIEGSRALALTCPITVGPRAPPAALLVPAAAERKTVIGIRARTVAIAVEGNLAHVDVEVPERDLLALDLLIDGAWRDVRVLEVDRHARVTFALPPGVKEGATVVVHAAEPWPLARGVFAAAVVGVGPLALHGEAPAQLRPAPLSCRERPPRFPYLWRSAFEIASGVFVIALVAGLWWRSRAEARRGALLALVSGFAISACLLGLDLVLRLGAAGGP